MVSSELFTFISKLFQKIHNNSLEFGGIPMLVIEDLAQLPPVKGDLVFNFPLWKSFFPLFFRLSRCQMNDNNFYNMLQEIKAGNITQKTIETIKTKVKNYQPLEDILDTTHIVSHRVISQTINSIISTKLPSFSSNCLNEESFTSIANDFVNNEQWTIYQAEKAFIHHTNYPSKLTLAVDARVMYLNND